MMGHYSNECTAEKAGGAEEGKQFLNSEGFDDLEEEEFLFYTNPFKHSSNIVSQNWVLLDNQSTIDVFQNKNLLTNIRDSGKVLKMHCNAGVATTSLMGHLRWYGEVLLYEKGIANILSQSRVKEWYRVTYDSQNVNKFEVQLNNGLKQTYSQSKAAYITLWHWVMKEPLTRNKPFERNTILNTVEENKDEYSKQEVLRATLAWRIPKQPLTKLSKIEARHTSS